MDRGRTSQLPQWTFVDIPRASQGNGTPPACTLLEYSSTFWGLLAARWSNSVSNSMKLKYYSLVLLGTNMHTFCTYFSRVVRFRVLVPRISSFEFSSFGAM